LDADSQRRLATNPLRTLDSKNPCTQTLLEHAPTLLQALSQESIKRFELNDLDAVLAILQGTI